MDYEIKLLRRAIRDLDDVCAYLSGFYPGTVGRFLEALEQSLDAVAHNPSMYAEYNANKQYRRMIVHNYLVFYRIFETSEMIRVYRILHGRLDLPTKLK
jgi:plasmid stabilization system protein ParE